MSNRTLLSKLERARVLLTATGTGELVQLLPSLGFDEAELARGHALYETCERLRVAADHAHGSKETGSQAMSQQSEKVKRQYTRLAKMARGVFAEDRTALKTLGLVLRSRTVMATPPVAEGAGSQQPPAKHTRRPSEAQDVFLGNARQIYDGALEHPQILMQLAKYGYTEERLRQERGDVNTLEVCDVEQEQLKIAAKQCTAEQQAAVAALQKWMSRFTRIMVPALDDRPDLLSSMGIKLRGRRAPA